MLGQVPFFICDHSWTRISKVSFWRQLEPLMKTSVTFILNSFNFTNFLLFIRLILLTILLWLNKYLFALGNKSQLLNVVFNQTPIVWKMLGQVLFFICDHSWTRLSKVSFRRQLEPLMKESITFIWNSSWKKSWKKQSQSTSHSSFHPKAQNFSPLSPPPLSPSLSFSDTSSFSV